MQVQPLLQSQSPKKHGWTFTNVRFLCLLFGLFLSFVPPGQAQENYHVADCLLDECPPTAKISCGDLLDPGHTGEPDLEGTACDDAQLDYSDALSSGVCSNGVVILRTWTLTDADGATNSCTQSIEIVDESDPVLDPVADFLIDGCSTDWPTLSTTWTDNCADAGEVTAEAGHVYTDSHNDCIQYRIYTFTVSDACGNTATETTKVTRDNSSGSPEVKDIPDFTIDANDHWPALKTNWWDDCAGEGKVLGVPGPIKTDGYNSCHQYRIYTFMYTNACGKYDIETTKVSRATGYGQPDVKDIPNFTIKCTEDWPELKADWWDDCAGKGKVVGVPGPVKNDGYDLCSQYRIYTFKYTNPAGKYDIETTKVSRNSSSSKPKVKDLPHFTIACGQDWPHLKTTWWDDCAGEGKVEGVPGPVQSDSYNPCHVYRIYTFKYTNACGKYDVQTTRVSRVDNEAPYIPSLSKAHLECIDEVPDADELMWLVKESVKDKCTAHPRVEVVGDTGTPSCSYGSFKRIYKVKLCDECGNCVTKTITFSGTCSEGSGGSFCTIPQGGWGNAGAYYPWTNYSGKAKVSSIISSLLASYGPLRIGDISAKRSLTIQSADCIIELLPGLGDPDYLPAGNAVASSYGGCAPYSALTSDGRLDNSLAAQTIALQLNLWYNAKMQNADLGKLPLGKTGLNLAVYGLSSGVETVDDLLAFANKYLALAGGQSYPKALAFTEALAKVNQYFDGCRQSPVSACGDVAHPESCADFCTLTVANWNSSSSKYPWGSGYGKASTKQIITALMQKHGDILVGDPAGNSLYIQDPDCVLELLPGDGHPDGLPIGDVSAGGYNCKPYGNKEINVLAAQVIALQLNIWYGQEAHGTNLGGLKFGGKCLSFYPGSQLAKYRIVVVQDLLDYANLYLSGQVATYGGMGRELFEAISKINGYFSGCHTSYGNIRTEVEQSNSDAFKVYPNPATDQAELQYESQADGTVAIRILDTNGKTVLTQEFDVVQGMNYLRLRTSDFSGGMYYIATQKGETLLNDRLIIMNR